MKDTAFRYCFISKSEELDKLEGLEVGGDDYMTKPFSNMELISKVKALIRRYRVYDSGSVNRKTRMNL